MINPTIEPLNHFLWKGMSQKYKLWYYLKRVYVGGFSYWSEQKPQTGLLKMRIHSLPVGGVFRNVRNIAVSPVTAVNKAALSSYIILYQVKWKCNQNFSEDNRFPSEVHSYKNLN